MSQERSRKIKSNQTLSIDTIKFAFSTKGHPKKGKRNRFSGPVSLKMPSTKGAPIIPEGKVLEKLVEYQQNKKAWLQSLNPEANQPENA